ncbi:MAG: U32 family peptidase [Oscillospiraceae bacterium]|nr:U32 family peptidase [Oscillospiraceae bacterium]
MSEILAPCGSFESLKAALNSGADAVYLGLKRFSARKNAENFSDEELYKATIECHKRGVKLYVALNTLVYDDELKDLAECVKLAAKSGADGIIVQDLGAAALIRKICPEMPRHASTQMTLNSVSGVKAAHELGFSRAVIGRELSREEIMKISREAEIELEIFVHGALCTSVSGQCYMSAFFGGRSGNRGLCAQPCRLDFSVNGRHNVISLKDSSIVKALPKLPEIASFKIEGRMKRPEYVSCAVDACVKSLSLQEYDEERLKNVFSRGGLTDGYFSGNYSDMNGIRGKDDVDFSAKALSSIRGIYKDEFPRIKVDIKVKIKSGEQIFASAYCCFGEVSAVSCSVPEKAVGQPLGSKDVCGRMSKLGGTQFIAGSIEADVEDGLYASASALNALRRDICEKLEKLVLEKNTPRYRIFEPSFPEIKRSLPKKTVYRAEVRNAEQLMQAVGLPFEMIYAPLELLSDKTQNKEKIAVALPLILNEEADRKQLLKLREVGFEHGFAQTLEHAQLLKEFGFKLHGGFRMNLLNSLSARSCEDFGFSDITLSVEGEAAKLSEICCNIPTGIVAYGKLPLTLMRRCPIADGRPCGASGGKNGCEKRIFDRFGREIPILCGGRSVELLNPDPLILSDKPEVLRKFDFVVFNFTDERDLKCIAEMYENKVDPSGRFTRGMTFEGVI